MATHAKRLISLVLTLAILMGLAVPSMAANGNAEATTPSSALSITPTENVALPTIGEISEELTADAIDFSKTVRVSIMLEGDSTLQAGYSTEAIAANASAMSYRQKLEQEQTRLISTIEQQVLHGQKLDVVWNLTLAANLISANIKRSEIDAIAALSGVKQVIEEECYAPLTTAEAGPLMQSSNLMSGAVQAWADGYTGAGSRVAIIDTGLDLNHQSFSSEALLYALSKNAVEAGLSEEAYLADLDLLDTDEVASVQDQLNVAVSPASAYRGEKVPFAYNYVDQNYRVTHDFDTQGEHGSHVAGISAANAYIKSSGEYVNSYDSVGVTGVAPDAQLIIMKVFGESGGAYNSDYMAAIEDAIVLGADSINLSLGSGSAGFTYAQGYEDIMQSLTETDTVVTISAGNSYSWPESTNPGKLYKEDVNFDTAGSPGSYSTALTVASVDATSFNGDGSYTAPDYYTMSDFSSWGVHGSLELKPEITAPGGDIYSINGMIGDGKQYESMSGTSMAAPQMAGMAAVMAQYIRENELEDVSGLTNRQLATSLLMSTSLPLKDKNGLYYPVMKQGSGMAVVSDAVTAKSFIKMDENATAYAADGKVKAELGEDADKSGSYSFTFTLKNLTDRAANYRLSTDLFTQALSGDYLSYSTTALAASYVYTVDGQTYVPAVEEFDCDLNGDGVTDAQDAKLILAAVLDGTTAELPEAADVDDNGTVDTYDAHLILENLVSGSIELPAGGKLTVTVTVTLTDEQKASLNSGYPNGAYIEGFTYVESADGTDVTHSIPILGFYGNWSDPDMFGISYTDMLYGDERDPYFGDEENNNLVIKSASTGTSYLHTGNPYAVESSYPADRAAVNSADVLSQYKLSLLRNAAAMRLQIVDENGKQLYSSGVSTYLAGAYYYVNAASWRNTSNDYTIGMTPASLGLTEGNSFTVEVTAVPEYYALRQTLDESSLDTLAASGVLGQGATRSVTLRVDDTAPVLVSAAVDTDTNELVVECSDNNYVAVIALTDLKGNVLKSVIPEQLTAGESITYRISLGGISGECLLVVGDYAKNQITNKLELAESSGGGDEGGEGTPAPGDVSGYAFDYKSNTWKGIHLSGNLNATVSGKIVSDSTTIKAAEYVDGYVYQVDGSNCLYVSPQSSLNSRTLVADLSSMTNVEDMAFNTKDNKLYLLGSENTIYTVDFYTGALTKQFTVSIASPKDGATASCYKLMGLAIDKDGNFVVGNHGGDGGEFAATLYRFSLDEVENGSVENVPYLSYRSNMKMYLGGYTDNGISMAYDTVNDCLYYFQHGRYNLDYAHVISLNTNDYYWNCDKKFSSVDGGITAAYCKNSSSGLIEASNDANSLTLSSSELNLSVGGTAKLTYEIGPWNLDNTAVTWSSNDESIATVQDGVITGVGKGTAVITATSVATPSLTASCTVTVQQPDPLPESVDFQGLIYGADSKTYWSRFSSDDTENWTSVFGPSSYFYGGVLVNGEILVHDGDALYAVDPDTFEAAYISGIASDYYWNDAAPAEGYDGAIAVLHYGGTYFGVLNAHAGSVQYKKLNSQFGSDPMANIALYRSYEVGGYPAYDYYVLTESGKLYSFTLTAAEGEDEELDFNVTYTFLSNTDLEQPGVSGVTDGASSSMLLDEASGYLFVTSYTSGDYANLYAIWPATGTTTELGHFGNGVWPANSLYHYDVITELTLRLKETEIEMFKGDTYAVKATVLPLSMTKGVTLESADSSIVSVNGTTLTAVAPGKTTVTVTTVDTDAAGSRSQTITVTVVDTIEVSAEFNAMVTTDDDHFFWSKLDTENLSSYDVIQESGQRIVSGGAHNGKLYVHDGVQSLFWGFIPIAYPLMIDPLNDFDAVAGSVIDFDYHATDLTTLPMLNVGYVEDGVEQTIVGGNIPLHLTPSGYLLLMDFEGGGASGWLFDSDELGGNPGGLAYDKFVTYIDEASGSAYDAHSYYMLTDTGLLYRLFIHGEYNAERDDLVELEMQEVLLCDTGLRFADCTDMSMVRIRDGAANGLLVASGNGLYFIDLRTEDYASGKIGSVPGASRISVLYTDTEIGAADTQSVETVYGSNAVSMQTFDSMQVQDPSGWIRVPFDVQEQREADGSLNAVKSSTKVAPNAIEAGSAEANTETVTLTLTETVAVTNGLVTVTYDPEVLKFDALSSGIQVTDYRVDEEAGLIRFSYASAKAAASGSTLATVRFSHELEGGILDTTLTLDTLQRNNESPITDASEKVSFNEHLEHSYTWTLVEEPTADSEGKLIGSCDCGLDGSDADATLPKLNTVDYDYVVVTEPTYSKPGKATFTWKNTEYGTWVFEVELPVLPQPSNPVVTPGQATVTTPTLPFVDVTGNDWFYSNVLYVYTNGLMSGVDATHFDPCAPMTRAMLWTVLARLDGVSTAGGATWYEKGQTWAMENGISDGTDPNGCITREQLVTMLWRYAGSPAASDAALDGFTDAASISDWARDAMAWAVENGILNGADGKLMPAANATRAEVSAILNRYCVNILKKS